MRKFYFSLIVLLVNTCINAQTRFLDSSFGNNGLTTTDYGVDDRIETALLQSDGKILGGGTHALGGNDKNFKAVCALVRYYPDGKPDSSFGTNGLTYTEIGNGFSYISSIALQNDNKILATGWDEDNTRSKPGNLLVLRYLPNGKIDSSFGTNGMIYVGLQANYLRGRTIRRLPDEKILVAADVFNSNGNYHEQTLVLKLNKNGTPDKSFGDDGKVLIKYGRESGLPEMEVHAGKIILAGYGYNKGKYQPLIARLTAEGKTDSSFGDNGFVFTDINSETSLFSLAVSKSGKIVTGGYQFVNNNENMVLTRHNANGSLDSSFGTNGIVITDIATEDIFDVLIQPDDKIVAAGSGIYKDAGKIAMLVARYLPNGKPDVSFGNKGGLFTAFPKNQASYGSTVLLQPDGKIISLGTVLNGKYTQNYDFALARYKAFNDADKQKPGLKNPQPYIKATQKPVDVTE